MADIDSAIATAKRRATSYEYVDGLQFLVWSTFPLVLGVCSLLLSRHHLVWAHSVFLGGCLGLLLILPPEGPVMLWLKSKLTYPRTGFVALPQSKPNRIFHGSGKRRVLQLVALGALLVGGVLSDYLHGWASLLAMSGGVGVLCIAYRDDVRLRPFWLFIPSLWVSAWVEKVFPIENTSPGGGYVGLVWAVFLFVVGGVQLFRYLKQQRTPQQ